MKIYLDTCCLNRPFDDRSQARVDLEASAIAAIFDSVRTSQVELMTSSIVEYEIDQTPDEEKRELVRTLFLEASYNQKMEQSVKTRATELEGRGFDGLDAAHLASAEAAGCEFLCTCDDRFLNKSRAQSDLRTKVVSPLGFIEEHLP